MTTRNSARRSRTKRSSAGVPKAPRLRTRITHGSPSRGVHGTRNSFRMFLVPCSCGTTFSVAENYDHQGTAWSRYLTCPTCQKRHDPKNRLLQMGFHSEGYWAVDEC